MGVPDLRDECLAQVKRQIGGGQAYRSLSEVLEAVRRAA